MIYQNVLERDSASATRDGHAPPGERPQVEVVVPVRNEECDLGPSIRRLHGFLRGDFPFSAQITIADNGSTDGTWPLAVALSEEYPGVRALRIDQAGRGRALHAVWGSSDADVLAYMDVDMSTDLNALLPLVAPLLSGHSDLAIGTRLARSARVVRGPRREFISRSYNLLLHAALGTRFSDAQCGFKAIRADRAAVLLPLVQDNGWFFDTELLVLAERAGLRVHEVPVDWIYDPDSHVSTFSPRPSRTCAASRVSVSGSCAARLPSRCSAIRPARSPQATAPGRLGAARSEASWCASPRSGWPAPPLTFFCTCCFAR